ncbi:hypothetical protein ACFLUD_01915 [Chloroflexota bacterium]
MAIVRCKEHPVQANQAKDVYVRRAKPMGFPNTAAICGRRHCNNPCYVWLTLEEHDQFIRGKRNYALDTALVSLRVTNDILELPEVYLEQITEILKL